jgi:hypothetical protein
MLLNLDLDLILGAQIAARKLIHWREVAGRHFVWPYKAAMARQAREVAAPLCAVVPPQCISSYFDCSLTV